MSKHSLAKSFACAMKGVVRALKSERNLRIHFSVGAWVLWFSRYYDLERGEWALLCLTVGLVIVTELMNTALETAVDLEMPVFHPLARDAKDIAAGAVLVSSVISVVVAFLLFWDTPTIKGIVMDILVAPVPWLVLAALTVLWIALFGDKGKKKP